MGSVAVARYGRTIALDHSLLAGAGVALLLVTNPSVIVPLNAVGIALLALSVTQATLTIGNRFVFACLVALCLLSTVGAIGAIPWGYGHPVQSAAIAVTSWMGLLLYCSGVTERFWQWVTAGVFVHAAATIWQGLLHYREPFYRATGLSDNPDPAAGYLDVAIVYLLVKGKWWATAPLILALHFTGTRLAFWGFLTIVLAMGLRKVLGWRQVAVLLAATFLFSAVLWPYSGRLYRLHDIKAEVVARAEGPPGIPKTHILPGILPQGYAGDKGYHVAPLRLLREIGWVGLGAWALVSGVAVWRSRASRHWWLILLLLGLASLDYYIIMPPASLLWWAAWRES